MVTLDEHIIFVGEERSSNGDHESERKAFEDLPSDELAISWHEWVVIVCCGVLREMSFDSGYLPNDEYDDGFIIWVSTDILVDFACALP